MTLQQYLEKHDLTPSEFARQLGVQPNTITRYVTGERIPRKAEMQRIYKATGGAVSANDFYDLRKGRAA